MAYFIGKILVGIVVLGLLFCAYQIWRFQLLKSNDVDQEQQEHKDDDKDNWSDF